MQLVEPAVKYKESFLAALREYQQEKTSYHEDLNMLDVVTVEQNFQKQKLFLGEVLSEN